MDDHRFERNQIGRREVQMIDSCMDCHANWKDTDFVSRKYLRPPPVAPVTR